MVFKGLGIVVLVLGLYFVWLGVTQPQLGNTAMNLGVGGVMAVLGILLLVHKRS